MGMYLNPGKDSYQLTLNSEVFVDKTGMIRYINSILNTQQRFVSVSRPRRFGKTTAADMICAYYDRQADSREMFEKLKLAKEDAGEAQPWDVYLNQFDVIRIVMTDFIKMNVSVTEGLNKMCRRILDELEETYPEVRYDPDDFHYSLAKFSQKSGHQYVIVIDEWDMVFRYRENDSESQKQYLDFLRDWMKDRSYIALSYMTGILPIKKYGKHSALNMFDDYSMMAPKELAPYTGFTDEEVKTLCQTFHMDYREVSNWYDGYITCRST